MSRVWLIARREWREQSRQPVMLAVIGGTFALILSLCALGLWASLRLDPEDVGLDTLSVAVGVVNLANWLLFTQLMGIVAVLAGHAMLHDRLSGVLPFLLLAPVRRWELLAGKVLGALGLVLAMYFAVCGVGFVGLAWVADGRVAPERLPPSAGWAVTFFIAGPGWTALLAVVCALVSSLARDVRTAQQVVWGVVLTTSLGGATLLAAAVTQPLWVQALVAATGWLCVVVAIAAGQEVISRDLGR